jgi:hypothetical protein
MDYLDPFGGDPTDELLSSLEAQLPLLPESDQEFVLGCRMNISSGYALDATSKQRLKQLAAQLSKAVHDGLEQGGGVQQPAGPTPLDMLRNLANVRHILRPDEQHFANTLAAKVQSNQTLSPNEMFRLSNMHKAKGF